VEAEGSSETSVPVNQTARCHVLEDGNLSIQCCENSELMTSVCLNVQETANSADKSSSAISP
jgi:hypothetical protein